MQSGNACSAAQAHGACHCNSSSDTLLFVPQSDRGFDGQVALGVFAQELGG